LHQINQRASKSGFYFTNYWYGKFRGNSQIKDLKNKKPVSPISAFMAYIGSDKKRVLSPLIIMMV